MSLSLRLLLLGTVTSMTFVGCAKPPPPVAPSAYTGPTMPLDDLLAAINRNNGRITTMQANGGFLLGTPQDGEINGTLTLFHTKPNQLRILCNKDAAGRVADLGTDGERFWMFTAGKKPTTWIGTNLGPARASPEIPISPELLVDVLGIATMNLDLLAQPVPTLRFNPDYDAYMLTWHQPLKDRWVTLREVWYDRSTLQPRRIWLFDRDGRVVVRAKLDRFEPMRTSESESTPLTARSFELFFPENKTSFRFWLDGVRDRRNGMPNRLSYQFNPPGESERIINLDQPSAP